MKHNRRWITATFMLVTIMLPFLIKIPVAHAETTEAGFTDYCLAGSDGLASSSSSDGSSSGPSVTITGIDTSLPAGQGAAKAVAKAVGEALKIDPSLIYGQMVQESGSSFNSSLASNEHNLSGIKYSSWESSLGSVGSAPSDGTGGNYTNFKDWNAYASAYASILKNHGVENTSTAADFVHKLKEAGYFTAPESQYLAGVTAGAASYYGNSATGSNTASDAAQSDSGTTSGSWRRGDDSLPPETYDTTWTTSPDSSSSSNQSSNNSTSTDSSTASDSMTQNAKKVFDFLTNTMGFSGAGAAAVLGNFQMESSFNPAASNGTHWGLAQWSASRLAAGNITAGDSSSMTIDNELKLLQSELNGAYSSVKIKVGNATDVDSATKTWDDEFEVSGGATLATRQKYAQAWYVKFNGASISANASLLGATSTADSASSSDSSSSAKSGSCSSSNSTSSGAWGWPFDSVKSIQDVFKKLDGATSEQAFGKSPSRSGSFHDGWDFGSAKYGTGSTIKAVHDGTVYKIQKTHGYWEVDVKSRDGYYEVYQEAFASRSDIAVSEGQNVKVGDKIGTLTDTHLHLGITKMEIDKANTYWNVNNGTWLNPVREIAGQGDTTTDDYGKTAP